MTAVLVWLGVQTGNQRTTREWTRPGNRPTISFWFGEFINGRVAVAAGLHALFHIIIILSFEVKQRIGNHEKMDFLIEKWIFWIDCGLTNLRQHFDIFLNECLFLTQEK